MAKKLVILGSTGSIGRQALEVVDQHPEVYRVIGLAAGKNIDLLAEQAEKYHPLYVSVDAPEGVEILRNRLRGYNKTEIFQGSAGLVNLAGLSGIDIILVAVSGIAGLAPTLAALEKGTRVALANKETLVTAGELVMSKAKEARGALIPVDSEHSAIFQCFDEENRSQVEKVILTASGGPFLNFTRSQMDQITPEMALKHPRWQMGRKITVDSSSLINKGLEVIEARWLFDLPYEKIQVMIHPQSIIHSMVQYSDGAVLAQLGLPDMRTPIQYAFTYPQRMTNAFPKLDISIIGELSFIKPDLERFPGLALAYAAGRAGGTMTTVYNAANEIAVELFLAELIPFVAIPGIIERVMNRHTPVSRPDLAAILASDDWARREAREIAGRIKEC